MNLQALLCILIAFSISCRPGPSPKDLVGKYSFNRSPYKDSLFIYRDQTYKHVYTTTSREVFKAEGKWRYDSLDSEILFKDFVFFSDSGTNGLPPGNWFSKVEITNDEVRLIYSSEDRIYFKKALNKF